MLLKERNIHLVADGVGTNCTIRALIHHLNEGTLKCRSIPSWQTMPGLPSNKLLHSLAGLKQRRTDNRGQMGLYVRQRGRSQSETGGKF